MSVSEKHQKAAEALVASRIDSMCITWDHSFGLMDEQQREALRRNFRQIAYHDLTPFIAQALSTAHREGFEEGMKRGETICYARSKESHRCSKVYEAAGDEDSQTACLSDSVEAMGCGLAIRAEAERTA